MLADAGRGIDIAVGRFDEGHFGEPKSMPRRFPGQNRGIAGAALPENEIVTDDDMGDAQTLNQYLGDEIFGCQRRQGAIKMKHEEIVNAEPFDAMSLDAKRRQAEGRPLGKEERTRVRLE